MTSNLNKKLEKELNKKYKNRNIEDVKNNIKDKILTLSEIEVKEQYIDIKYNDYFYSIFSMLYLHKNYKNDDYIQEIEDEIEKCEKIGKIFIKTRKKTLFKLLNYLETGEKYVKNEEEKKYEKIENETGITKEYLKKIYEYFGFQKNNTNLGNIGSINYFSYNYFYTKSSKESYKKQAIFSHLADDLTNLLHIKKTSTKPIKYYYLDQKEMTYKELNEHNLGIFLKILTNNNFSTSDCRKIIETINNKYNINNNYINCKNGLLNKYNGELESKNLIYEELITDNLMFTSGDSKSELLEYIPDVQINNADPTLLEKTLKEICIPKSEPENKKIYIDRLQRFGANILDRKHKSIGYYYTNHSNSGKSGLRSIHSRLMNCAVINPDIMNDQFNYKVVGGKKAILIDETQKGDLEKNENHIKLWSSPDTRQDKRIMFKEDEIKIKFGNLEIYTNYLMNLNKDEEALFSRIDIIQLPNKFVETEEELEKVKNSYIVNEKLFDNGGLIETDYKGWCWLASASIQEYLKMKKAGKQFECRQNTKETMQILLKADPLTEFLVKHITYVDDGSVKTSNKEILTEFKYFCETKGYSITDSDNSLSATIGLKLKEEYGNYVKSDSRRDGAKYYVRLKKIEEIEDEFRQVYIMDEDLTEKQLNWLETLAGHRKRIYDDIKTGEANTIFKLNKKYHDIDNAEIVKELENLGLIVKTSNTSIN